MHEVLVKSLVKLAEEEIVIIGEMTVPICP